MTDLKTKKQELLDLLTGDELTSKLHDFLTATGALVLTLFSIAIKLAAFAVNVADELVQKQPREETSEPETPEPAAPTPTPEIKNDKSLIDELHSSLEYERQVQKATVWLREFGYLPAIERLCENDNLNASLREQAIRLVEGRSELVPNQHSQEKQAARAKLIESGKWKQIAHLPAERLQRVESELYGKPF